jgi:hypothetical protein
MKGRMCVYEQRKISIRGTKMVIVVDLMKYDNVLVEIIWR